MSRHRASPSVKMAIREIVYNFSSRLINNIKYRRRVLKLIRQMCQRCHCPGHPRFVLLYLPTYCPRANPIERAFGDVDDNCARNHRRKRLRDLVSDVEEHFEVNGPWRYKLPSIYYEPEVTAAVEKMAANEKLLAA